MEPKENQDQDQVLETDQEEEETPKETPQEEEQTEDAQPQPSDDEKDKKLAELESKNKQLFERLKKAEKAPTTSNESLSNKDILFLAKVDIHEEDLDDVLDWAKFKKIPVNEAYKQMKPTLDVRTEERKTAQASSTRSGARAVEKTTGEDILKRVEKTGDAPQSEDELKALAEARFNRKLKANKRRDN